jgi:serine/threonine-protein kinase
MALPNKAKIPVGTVLAGKYRITREIGRGGMAAVYEAANVDIGKRVAIKVLAQELTASAVVVERFLREARAAAAIRSPYICDVYDSGRLDDGRPFLVLELLEGESLYERMTKIRWLDIDTTLAIVSQTCRGLTKAHAAQIVHRDLKPENIFLTKDEEGKLLAKILDFGLAKFYAPMEGAPQARLTREGAVFGTPAYMSPEQVRGQGAVDHRADLWALGCIVYECFTGRTVWSTEQGVAMTFAQIANAQLPEPATYRPDLPAEFSAWFKRALDRDINKRFQTAKEFADEFARVFNKERVSEVSTIGPNPALSLPASVRDRPSLENPFLSGAPSTPSPAVVPAAPSSAPATVPAAPPSAARRADVPTEAAPPASQGSSASVPVDLVSDKSSLAGAGGETTSGPASPRPSKLGFATPAPKRASGGKLAAIIGGGLVVTGGIAFIAWTQLGDHTSGGPTTNASASTSASVAPPASASGEPSAVQSARAPVVEPPPAVPVWVPLVRDGQQALATGDLKGASKLFKEAFDRGGGHGVPRTLLEHLAVASASGDRAACKLTGLARPRAYDVAAGARVVPAGRPSIAIGPKGPVMTWTDAHEGSERAYSVLLDEAMRAAATPIDVTPEGVSIARPEIHRVGDKFVLAYADGKGAEAGVHARFLDAEGHIAGPAVQVSPAKPGSYHPAIAVAPDNSFYAAWSDELDTDSEDLFLRHLGPNLEVSGDPVRATDLVPAGPGKPRARVPSIGVAGSALLLAFRLERDPNRLIQQIRIPIADAAKGLEPAKKGERRADRTIGELTLVNTDKAKSDGPILACGGPSCFLVWHGEQNGGANAAFIDPVKGQPLSRRKVSRVGAHPSVAVSASGQAQVVWYESGKILTASITRDGVGTPTKIARVSGEQPAPSIVAGAKPGEWYFSWLDYETGHLEAYAARVQCK